MHGRWLGNPTARARGTRPGPDRAVVPGGRDLGLWWAPTVGANPAGVSTPPATRHRPTPAIHRQPSSPYRSGSNALNPVTRRRPAPRTDGLRLRGPSPQPQNVAGVLDLVDDQRRRASGTGQQQDHEDTIVTITPRRPSPERDTPSRPPRLRQSRCFYSPVAAISGSSANVMCSPPWPAGATVRCGTAARGIGPWRGTRPELPRRVAAVGRSSSARVDRRG
jgi:hypothetical protein